jgi:hypothetical protein
MRFCKTHFAISVDTVIGTDCGDLCYSPVKGLVLLWGGKVMIRYVRSLRVVSYFGWVWNTVSYIVSRMHVIYDWRQSGRGWIRCLVTKLSPRSPEFEPGRSMWGLWYIEVHWKRVLSWYEGFILSLLLPRGSILIFVSLTLCKLSIWQRHWVKHFKKSAQGASWAEERACIGN